MMLSKRLETLRNERAARAPEIKKQVKEPVSAGPGARSPLDEFTGAPQLKKASGNKRRNRRKKGKR